MAKLIVLIPLAVIYLSAIIGAILGSGGGDRRIDENRWDD